LTITVGNSAATITINATDAQQINKSVIQSINQHTFV